MVSLYDVFYVIALRGSIKTAEIVKALDKEKKDYQAVYNKVSELEKLGYIEKTNTNKIINSFKTKKLFDLISFCIENRMNYNLLFKDSMLNFLSKAVKKEYFTIKDVRIHPSTFNFYVNLLSKYGLAMIISKKPFRCKILKHSFLINLLVFFQKDYKFYSIVYRNLIKTIEKELKVYRRNKKIHYSVIEDLERGDEINFIHKSLHMEGNPLTLPETEKLIRDRIIPKQYRLIDVQEVANYKDAFEKMIENSKKKRKLDLELVLEYHKKAMGHIPEGGKIRKQSVRIKLNPYFKTANFKDIPILLDSIFKKYREFESKKESIEEIIWFSSYFHNEFQRIHPFIDGNSRISRLLMLHILRSYDLPVLDFPLGYLDMYMNLTKESEKRDDKSFSYLIQEIVLVSLKKINSQF